MAPGIDNNVNSNQLNNAPSILSMPNPYADGIEHTSMPESNPPPLPPRVPFQNNSGYNNYRTLGYMNNGYGNNGYGNNGYGSNGYGNINYRSYNGFNFSGNQMPYPDMAMYNYGPMAYGNHLINSFQQYVEGTTRPVFNLIDSVLSTLSSITTVVESSHYALTNSFRAYESVVDNANRMRTTFGQLLSTFTLVRFLKWIYNKVLFLLGLRNQESNEVLWQQSISKIARLDDNAMCTWHTSFLLVIIFGVIPYLIHKIVNNVRKIHVQVQNPNNWFNCVNPIQVATAMYNFPASSSEELNLTSGQKIWLAPASLQDKNLTGWLIATDGKNVGMVPSNYIKITGQLKKPENPNSTNIINVEQNMSQPTNLKDVQSANANIY